MERLRMERQQPQCRLGVHRIERCENFLSLFPHIFIFVLFVSSGEKRTTEKPASLHGREET